MNYPELFFRGDKVEVATNREFTDSMYGEIIRVASNAVNIRYTTEGEWGILRFCWHQDDPRMEERGKFEAAMDRNTDDVTSEIHMGLFKLAKSQKIINETPALLQSLNEKIDAMDTVIERLMRKVESVLGAKQSAKPALPARKRGRPAKEELPREPAPGEAEAALGSVNCAAGATE